MQSSVVDFASLKGLLEKEMSRQEFLLYLGVLFLALTGISGLFKKITDPHSLKQNKIAQKGFGRGAYGS